MEEDEVGGEEEAEEEEEEEHRNDPIAAEGERGEVLAPRQTQQSVTKSFETHHMIKILAGTVKYILQV